MGYRSVRAPDRWYYFAYGSNMSLKQMAERCPASLLMGKGRIEGYRWQINERGVANIVKSARDRVEGLLYQVDAEDKRQLNRSEGVAQGFYDDERLRILFLPLLNPGIKTFHVAKQLEKDDERDAEQRGHQPSGSNSLGASAREAAFVTRTPSQQSPWRYSRQESLETVEALVYVSHEYKNDELIRSEYVARMEKAITDGRKLGLSDSYLNQIDRIIHQETPPRQNNEAYRSSYSPQRRMENGSTSHDPYEALARTRSGPTQYEEAPTNRPSYPRHVNVITIRPRYQNFDDVDDVIERRETGHADERPRQLTRDTGRRSEVRGNRRDKSPPRSRQSRSRDKQTGAGWSRRITRRSIFKFRPEQFFEPRKRSNSSPY